MPDPNDPHNKGGIPQKPKNIDQAAYASEQNQKAANEAARKVYKAHEDRQNQRRADAQRQLDKTKEPPPSMRMYGQNRFVNMRKSEHPEMPKEPSKKLTKMTPAQQEMLGKLKAARAADRQQTRTAYDDKKYVKLPDRPQRKETPAAVKKELTPAQQEMVAKMDAAREADRIDRAKAPDKPPPGRAR